MKVHITLSYFKMHVCLIEMMLQNVKDQWVATNLVLCLHYK